MRGIHSCPTRNRPREAVTLITDGRKPMFDVPIAGRRSGSSCQRSAPAGSNARVSGGPASQSGWCCRDWLLPPLQATISPTCATPRTNMNIGAHGNPSAAITPAPDKMAIWLSLGASIAARDWHDLIPDASGSERRSATIPGGQSRLDRNSEAGIPWASRPRSSLQNKPIYGPRADANRRCGPQDSCGLLWLSSLYSYAE